MKPTRTAGAGSGSGPIWLLGSGVGSGPGLQADVARYGSGLAQLVRVAGTRWIVEEDFQTAKGQAGLDQHQVRRWNSWHRHATLALAALAILAICAADASQADDHAQPDTIRLSRNEIRRLINILILHPARSTTHHLRWSNWRLQHRARARQAHYTRRLNLEFQP